MALSDPNQWKVEHPATFYAWEGACIWIPCRYNIPKRGETLHNLTVYHNFEYNTTINDFKGTILYNSTKNWESQGRVRFLGNQKDNCTLSIDSLRVQDSGKLGLRMMTKDDKWMEAVNLSISSKAWGKVSAYLRVRREARQQQLLGQESQTEFPAKVRQRDASCVMWQHEMGHLQREHLSLPFSSCPF